ncbi:MAG: ABC transporter substrate-binding protein [bacterium]|nr:ABC transporter substrate-binding protein [bacterium]
MNLPSFLNYNKENQDKATPVHRKHFTLKQTEIVKRAIRHFSLFEKTVFFVLFSVMMLTAGIMLTRVNNIFVETVPIEGGTLSEGVIGSARFINPILAVSDSDRDLTNLVYSGLMRSMPDGSIIPDMAKSYKISDDGKTYTFILKDDLTFHDGTKVTTDDIEFTVSKIQDGAVKSPKRPNWESVIIEKINEREIRFHLRQAYAPFLENTTVGIIPKNLFKDISAEEFPLSLFNFEPIGSGPYKIETIKRTGSGLPQTYTLSSFKKFALGVPYIKEISISFYPNEATLFGAYLRGDIEAVHSVTPDKLSELSKPDNYVLTAPLPRIFAVFFNQNQATVFTDQKVRQALDSAIDRTLLVKEVLNGLGVPVSGPLPPEIATPFKEETLGENERINKARNILTEDGWILNEESHIFEKTIKKSGKKTDKLTLQFSLSTGNAPELKRTALLLKDIWEKVGAEVEVKIFETGDLNQNVIRPRKYDALLFGEVVGRDLDLFAFWHSSQRNDPGLNIAMYTNLKIDKILEEGRTLKTVSERLKSYQNFAEILTKETPAVFLYSPDFIYLLPTKVKGVELQNITIPSDRFAGVYNWFIESENVWKFFVR